MFREEEEKRKKSKQLLWHVVLVLIIVNLVSVPLAHTCCFYNASSSE